MRSKVVLGGALLALWAVAPVGADDWGKATLEAAVAEQGNNDPRAVESVQDLYLRVRYRAYKEGSGGREIQDEGFLREFYRAPDLLRIEVVEQTGEGIANVKVYDGKTGRGIIARHNVAEIHRGDKPLEDAKSLDQLRDQLRPLRFLLLTNFLREGARAELIRAGSMRKIRWTDGEETLVLYFENFWLKKVEIHKTGEAGEEYDILLEGQQQFGPRRLLFPTKAIVLRGRGGEKVLELDVMPEGLVVNPEIDPEIYRSAAAESPEQVQ